MFKGYPALCSVTIIILLALGCSSGGGTPVTPDNPVMKSSGHTPNQQILLGLYNIELDGKSGTVNVTPLRGPAFQVNVVQYLQPPAGNPANLGISFNPDGSDIPNGIFDLDVSITHPFPGSNMRGFDVRGIVFGVKGTQLSQFDYEVQYPKPNELRLLNADGYTRWWNAVEFLTPGLFGYTPPLMGNAQPKATVNGYKYFADGLGADDPLALDTAIRGTFSTQDELDDPNTLTRQYIIKFPTPGGTPVVKFSYAILSSFAPPDPGNPPPADVDAYPLEANSPEAYQLSVLTVPSSTAYWTSTQSGGDLILNVEIYDWQALENSAGVADEIGMVRMESPTLWDGLIDPIASGIPIGTSNPTSSAWMVEIKDVTPTDQFQEIFLTVQSADPTSYAPPIPGAGIYPGGAVLSAYQIFTLDLPGNSAPVIGDIFGPLKYVDSIQLMYTLASMNDLQDGMNLTVEWDFDGDGIFEDDEDGSNTNMTGTFTFTGEDDFFVQCRVFDTAMEYSDSNVLIVEPMSLPFSDPMDETTETLWTVENGIFDIHSASLEWNVQNDHWATGSSSSGNYQDYMNTTLISPMIPTGVIDTLTITVTHRYKTENNLDDCRVYYRLNSGSWATLSSLYSGTSPGHPAYMDLVLELTGFTPGDFFELGFAFDTDSSITYQGWDVTHLTVIDNKPPDIDGIWGPTTVDSTGPWAYSTSATDLDGIASYMWSLEAEGVDPVYDDPGDGMGSVDLTFPGDGNWEVCVEVTDNGDPQLSSTFGPYDVYAFFAITDAFFTDDFDEDTGAWTYTGGTGDGSYQDFWHIETGNSLISNVGPDGCFAETASPPIEKTASRDILFPDSADETSFRMLHILGTESGGGAGVPYDGQWVTIDGVLIEPVFGFLYDDHDGEWDHGYFVGYTGSYVTSTFQLGTAYNDGLDHTLTFHQLSSDTSSNCGDGWQIGIVEFWLVD